MKETILWYTGDYNSEFSRSSTTTTALLFIRLVLNSVSLSNILEHLLDRDLHLADDSRMSKEEGYRRSPAWDSRDVSAICEEDT
jgi:hypothetical protein